MPRLVVIGNGFDIAHGLNTRYSDFMEYLRAYEREPQRTGSRFVYGVSAQDREKHCFYDAISKYIPEQDLWSSFEEALSFLDYEQIQEDNSCYLLDYSDENWRDSANHDFQAMIREGLSFAANIPRYFSDWIMRINTNVCPVVPSGMFSENCFFLNFNYTDTLERAYKIPESDILYIHGKALRGDDLIVGHHNAELFQEYAIPAFNAAEEHGVYLEDSEEDFRVHEAREIIRDYFRATYKDTAAIIRLHQPFFNALTDVDKVFILGHSLSDIDFDYFAEIRKNVLPTCKWRISYYDNDDIANAHRFARNLSLNDVALFKFDFK